MELIICFIVFLVWANWGAWYGVISGISMYDVPDQPLWVIVMNGPLWWVVYYIFKKDKTCQ